MTRFFKREKFENVVKIIIIKHEQTVGVWTRTSPSLLLVKSIPVPVQSLVVEAVEEVRFRSHRPDVWVDAEKLQQSSGSSLLHSDDDGLRKLLTAEAVGYRHVAAAAA